jgi:hypothetical protein
MDEMIKIFFGAGRIRPEDENEQVVAPGRNQSRKAYEATFRDELHREDMKLSRIPYPEDTCDPRRRQELADGGMVREDQNAMANLSPRAIHHEYPRLPYYSSPYIYSLARIKSRKGTK